MTNETTRPEKTADLPPFGPRNPDPITDAAGSHPIETGVGAMAGGAATGAAVGLVAGPIGAAIGAVVGAVAGGYAGKGVGEMIDPTTEVNWLREYHGGSDTGTYAAPAKSYSAEDLRPAYKYGIASGGTETYVGKRYEDVEAELRSGYESDTSLAANSWVDVRGAVRDAYDRSSKLYAERKAAE